MNTEQEIRKNSFNEDDNFWKRKMADGTVECLSKEYFNADGTRRKDEILKEIEEELLK
jgi:hypothetical protein